MAGNGTGGYSGDGVPATSAWVSAWGLAVDSAGSLYIADGYSRVRKVSSGIITTVVGTSSYGFSGDGGPAASAQVAFPRSVAVDSTGNFYIGDAGNYRIRKVAGGIISTIAGNGFYSFSGDGGPATDAQLSGVSGLATDAEGNIYIADSGSGRVRVVSSGGGISTFAGGGTSPADGIPATSATLVPGPIAASGGDLYVRDTANRVLRKVSSGIITTITTIAGQGSYIFPGGGGVAVDSGGRIYVSDTPDSRVRMLTPLGGMVPVSITSSPAGVSIRVTGTGCAAGTYKTPVNLSWRSQTDCSIRFSETQLVGSAGYEFQSSTVNGSAASHQNPLTINSGTTALTINAMYEIDSEPSGGDDGGKGGGGTVPVSITSSPAGVSIRVTGTGCAAGTYKTPANLSWHSQTDCSIRFSDPQLVGSAGYEFQSSTVNGSATSQQNPLTINSGTTALTINATYEIDSEPSGGDDGGQGGDGAGGQGGEH